MSKLTKALTAAAGNAGGDNLYVEDVFSTYLYTGNGVGQAIENGINLGDANVGGSGFVNGAGDRVTTTESLGSGDFTVEFWAYTLTAGDDAFFDTRTVDRNPTGLTFTAIDSDTVNVYDSATRLTINGISYLNQWVHFVVERSSGTITVYVNGTSVGSVANTTNYSDTNFSIGDSPNYGDTDAYISNFRLVKGSAVYGGNFTPPTEPLTAIAGTALLTLQSPEPFTDNSGNSLAITQAGNVEAQNFGPFTADEAGAGGMVWLKSRDQAYSHTLYDTDRGATKYIMSNATSAESTLATGLTSFNSDGFTHGSHMSTDNVASWTFRKAEKFFDVVTYTGDANDQVVSHSLGSSPKCIIIKATSATGDWIVYHSGLSNSGANYSIKLNTTAAEVNQGGLVATDANFTLYDTARVNSSGVTYVAYLFASDAGGFGDDGSENIIKCGSFTTDGSGNATVDLGFEPQWFLIKRTDGADPWYLFDSMRGFTTSTDAGLQPNSSDAEFSLSGFGYPTATGWSNVGDSGNLFASANHIYIAIRRPMKTPESGTEVFNGVLTNSDNSTTTGFPVDIGFPVDLAWVKYTTLAAGALWMHRLTGLTSNPQPGKGKLSPASTSAEANSGELWGGDNNTGYRIYGHTYQRICYGFKRATGFFDVVAYTGNGVVGRTVNHNLGVVPELMIIKQRNASGESWLVYHTGLTSASYEIKLNFPFPETSSTSFNGTAPTSSVFSVGGGAGTNGSGSTYIAYLFATVAGVSKVGSYTGTGSNIEVDCGFSAGARFVLIKRKSVDYSSGWYVWDSARGIVAGNDPYFLLNSTAAEVTSTDYIDPLSSGFTVTSSAPAALNNSGETYIFLAIA